MTLDFIFNSKTHSPYNPKLNPLTLKSAFLRSYPLTSVKIFYIIIKNAFSIS
ncbi:hypothetical protein N408_06400 [Helicobacter pylori FD703]|uniref:Uncharacterized protein n=1 Tax=Helicobacter pylori R038b TaxID=1145115 RepID=K2LHN3_HELPX|nr:hypothetical protein OUM_1340 [Helicobacter pylori R038b]EQL66512.1 hypothetical protein N408_06400 [Helicobacter pylori FD703]